MNVKSRVTVDILVGLVVVLALVFPVAAQDKPADNMEIVVEKIRADKKLFIAQNMQLTEAEAKVFWPVYEQYQDEFFLLRVRVEKLIKDYAQAYDKMTNDTARRLLARSTRSSSSARSRRCSRSTPRRPRGRGSTRRRCAG